LNLVACCLPLLISAPIKFGWRIRSIQRVKYAAKVI
jgi:hypothetical protein